MGQVPTEPTPGTPGPKTTEQQYTRDSTVGGWRVTATPRPRACPGNRTPTPPRSELEPLPGADPGWCPYRGLPVPDPGASALGGSRTRNIRLLKTASLPVGVRAHGADTRCRPGSSAVRRRSRSRAHRHDSGTGTRTPIDSSRDCRPADETIPDRVRGAGLEPADGAFLSASAMPVSVTRAYLARDLNSVLPIKSRVHSHTCSQGLVGAP
jgi:hypothetical protein